MVTSGTMMIAATKVPLELDSESSPSAVFVEVVSSTRMEFNRTTTSGNSESRAMMSMLTIDRARTQWR